MESHDDAEQSKISRRGFLIAITGSALAAAAACRPADLIAPTVYAPGSTPFPAGGAAVTPPGEAVLLRDPVFGEVTFDEMRLTDVADLYITQYDYNNTPAVDAATWRLAVDGLVENPLTLDYDEVRAMPAREDMRVLECISNPVGGNLIGNLIWKGFLFQEVLDRVGVRPEATHVRFEAADGYTTAVRLEWMMQPGTLLAYEMNGEPLTVPHGFPLRLHIPGLYGQKMPRWLTRIEFIDYDYIGFWESRGWSNVADVRTKSIIRSPNQNAVVGAGSEVALQGVAFAGRRRIEGVDVRIESGEWMPATLLRGPSPLAWTQWYITWTLPAPGTYRIAVRATDDTGFAQTSEAIGIFGGAFPNGTDAIHAISIRAG